MVLLWSLLEKAQDSRKCGLAKSIGGDGCSGTGNGVHGLGNWVCVTGDGFSNQAVVGGLRVSIT